MYVNCQGALAIKIWPGIFILKNCEVHQNQKNGTKQPNGYILSAYNHSMCNHHGKRKSFSKGAEALIYIEIHILFAIIH